MIELQTITFTHIDVTQKDSQCKDLILRQIEVRYTDHRTTTNRLNGTLTIKPDDNWNKIIEDIEREIRSRS